MLLWTMVPERPLVLPFFMHLCSEANVAPIWEACPRLCLSCLPHCACKFRNVTTKQNHLWNVVHCCLSLSRRLSCHWISSLPASFNGTNTMLTLNSHVFVFSLNASETICKQVLPKSCWGVWSGGYRHVGSPNENGIFRCRIFQFLFGYTFVVISGPSLNIWTSRIENGAALKSKSDSIHLTWRA